MKDFSLPIQNPLHLTSYLHKYSKEFIIQAVGGILFNTVIVAGPIFLGLTIDGATALWNEGVSPERLRPFTLACLLYIAVTIFFQYARYVKRWYIRNMSNQIANDMRAGILQKTLQKEMPLLDQESVGDLMSRTVGDVDQIVSTVQSTINEAWDTWLMMLSYFVVLLWYDWKITLLCSIPIPFVLFLAESVRHPLYKVSSEARKTSSRINSHLQNTLNAILTLRLFGREQVEYEKLHDFSRDQMNWTIKTNLLQGGMAPIYSTLASLGVVGVLYLAGQQVMSGLWSLGRFTSFLSMFVLMSSRTWVAARVINQFHGAAAAWDRIKEKIKDNPTEILRDPLRSLPDTPVQSTEDEYFILENVSFSYPNSSVPVLTNLTLRIPLGSLVAVTGPVGSGKSSLAVLLTGLYPYEGSIRYRGRELRNLDPASRLSFFAYGAQEAFLFSSSLYENVTFQPLAEWKTDVRFPEVLRSVVLDRDLPLLPQGAETLLGEKGVRLSGGQRQRVALARSLYPDREVLILDDPFSAVDIQTESQMIQRLTEYKKDKTVFLFSHRLRTFAQADLVLFLQNGSLSAMGSHEELIQSNSLYRQIYEAQEWMEREEDELQKK